jgi:hypothetical protein
MALVESSDYGLCGDSRPRLPALSEAEGVRFEQNSKALRQSRPSSVRSNVVGATTAGRSRYDEHDGYADSPQELKDGTKGWNQVRHGVKLGLPLLLPRCGL